MTSLVQHITIDCADAYQLALFWAEVLGSPLSDDDAPGDPEALVEAPGAALLFVTVPEPKSGKNRVHLDVRPEDRTRDEEVEGCWPWAPRWSPTTASRTAGAGRPWPIPRATSSVWSAVPPNVPR